MTKALHALVYIFLVLAAAALWFELQLNSQRSMLTDRNRLQEDYFVRIAKTIETKDQDKATPMEIKKDVSPVEARLVESPDMENVLDEYKPDYEAAGADTFNWENSKSREQLRAIYVLDGEGKPVKDGNQFLMKGPGTEDEILGKLFEAAKLQQARLNNTRAELPKLREKIDGVVRELNEVKPVARQALVTIEEKKEQISQLESEKADLESAKKRLQNQVDELNTEITSLKDEVTTAKDETEAVKEELTKATKQVEDLKKLLVESFQTKGSSSSAGTAAVTSLSVGNKGKLVKVDNENMFAIVEFTPEAIKELKGEEGKAPIPQLELGIRRPGFKGPAGEFVGRVRIRQEVQGKPIVVCDILATWEQDKAQVGDVVFAD